MQQQFSQFHHLERENSPLYRLYRRHWQALFAAICQHISTREDAEDILLDVFLVAMESETLLSMGELRQEAWLRWVTYNKCMDFHRRATRRPVFPLNNYEEAIFEDERLAPEWIALRQEELGQLKEHLAALPSDQQELLRLRFVDELSCDQIAVRMHKSGGSVRTLLSRTLNRLRDIYRKREDGN